MMAAIDPVTFEVIWHRLLDTTEEMGIKYGRTSGSPMMHGGNDASTVITTGTGELVAVGPYFTTQGHMLPPIINAVMELTRDNPGIRPGDMFVCNDPYLGATHQPDVATLAPIFHGDELVAWSGASGHWLDIGGSEPGSVATTARTVFDEGLRIPPMRIVEEGVIRSDLVRLIMNQVRDPLTELDLTGQIVANWTAAERIDALFGEYGPETVLGAMHQGIEHVERRLRTRLGELPDGTWREVQYMDHDGQELNLRKIVCTVTKRGDELVVDFTGTDPQTAGFANCTFGGLRAATLAAVSIMLGYDLTWNDGISRCVRIVAPPETCVTATYPFPVSGSTISAVILSLNTVFPALSKMLLASADYRHEAMANWCGTSLGQIVSGLNDRGVMTVYPENSHFAAGAGARSYRDGVSTGGIIINTTASIASIESIESDYPVLNLFRRQLVDSGGAGKYRGGLSGEVAFVPYHAGGPLEAGFAGFGGAVPNGIGIAGGLPGAAVRYIRYKDTSVPDLIGSSSSLPAARGEIAGTEMLTMPFSPHQPFTPGMVEYHSWQGGGGFGDPLERDPVAVAEDVKAELVSPEEAWAVHGVAVDAHGQLLLEETTARRADLLRERLARSRPAPEVVDDSDWDAVGSWVTGAEGSGKLTYGDVVTFDFDADAALCLACGHRLGGARERFQRGCVAEEAELSKAGPIRGQDYAAPGVQLILYYCPGCARQLDVELTVSGGPRAGFRLAPPD
jgi:N-methylhydantoinase B